MSTKAINQVEVEEDIEITEEEKKAVYRMNEPDILAGLLAAAKYKTDLEETATINIKRQGKVVLSFRIRPLGEEEYFECRKKNTTYRKNKQVGTRVAESVDTARYRAQLIYTATVQEDREKLWDNREAWHQLNVLNGVDLVEVVLMAGEKDEILTKLDEISGYQASLEETAKN